MVSARNHGVIVEVGQAVTVDVTGFAGVGIQLTGVWTATVQFKGSVDGVVFNALTVFPTNSTSGVTSATSNGTWQAGVALTAVQVLCSAYTSGYIVVSLTASTSAPSGGGGGGGISADVNVNGINGVAPSVGNGTSDTGTLRVAVASNNTPFHVITDTGSTTVVTGTVAVTESGTWTVQPGNTPNSTPWLVTTGHGKTIKSLSGSLTADTDIIAAVTSKRIKVIGYAFFTFGTSANLILLKSNGTSGTLLWTVTAQAASSSTFGANMGVSAPSFIFATAAGEKLTADVNQSDTIYWSISYFDDDAT